MPGKSSFCLNLYLNGDVISFQCKCSKIFSIKMDGNKNQVECDCGTKVVSLPQKDGSCSIIYLYEPVKNPVAECEN